MASRPKQKLINFLQMMKDGLTRAEIAERRGVSLRTVYNWERKARETLGTATTIEAICLACKSGWLRKDPDEEPQDQVEERFHYKTISEILREYDDCTDDMFEGNGWDHL